MRSTQSMDKRGRVGACGRVGRSGMTPSSALPCPSRHKGPSVDEGIEKIKAAIDGMYTLTGGLPQAGWRESRGALVLSIHPPLSVPNGARNLCMRGEVVAVTLEEETARAWDLYLTMHRIPCAGANHGGIWDEYESLNELLNRRQSDGVAWAEREARSLRVDVLRCMTVHQIWAWAILDAGKDVENRSFRAAPGLLGIHMGLNADRQKFERCAHFVRGIGIEPPAFDACMEGRGRILGTVEVVGCERRPESRWFMGTKYGWLLANPRWFAVGYPARGAIGLWSWEPPRGRVVYAEELNKETDNANTE